MTPPPTPTKTERPNKALLTRQEIADILGISVDTIRRHESEWGFKSARRDLSRRCVRYRTVVVWAIMEERQWV